MRGAGLHANLHLYALDSLDSHYSLKILNRNQPWMPGNVAASTLATQGFPHLQLFQVSRDLNYNTMEP